MLGSILSQATGTNSTAFMIGADGKLLPPDPRSLAQQQAITQLAATIMGVVATSTGVDAPAAVTAAVIEAENNTNARASLPGTTTVKIAGVNITTDCPTCTLWSPNTGDWGLLVQGKQNADGSVTPVRADGTPISDAEMQKNGYVIAYATNKKDPSIKTLSSAQDIADLNKVGIIAREQLINLLNPEYVAYKKGLDADAAAMSNANIMAGPAEQLRANDTYSDAKKTKPTAEQVNFIIDVMLSKKVSSTEIDQLVRYNGGIDNLLKTGQTPEALSKAFKEMKTLMQGAGHNAYLQTTFAEFNKYSKDPSLVNTLSPAEAKRIALAMNYVSYQAAVNSDKSATDQASDQRFRDVMREVSTGNFVSTRGAIGVTNGVLVDTWNTVTFIPSLLTSNGLAVQDIPNTANTPGEQAQASIGRAGGNIIAIMTPAAAAKAFGLTKVGAGLTAETAATIEGTNTSRLSGTVNTARGAALEALPGPTRVVARDAVDVGVMNGRLMGNPATLSTAERTFVNEQLAAGKKVDLIPTSTGRTADFVIDGTRWELKTVSNSQNLTSDGISRTVMRALSSGRGQSGNMIIDARNQPGITLEIAQRGIDRFLGMPNPNNRVINSIQVLTPQGIIRYPR